MGVMPDTTQPKKRATLFDLVTFPVGLVLYWWMRQRSNRTLRDVQMYVRGQTDCFNAISGAMRHDRHP